MSVILETSVGEIVIDLFCKECPKTAKNFLKLCKIKYYNNCLFYNVQQDTFIQTGDPTGTGTGGKSIYGVLEGKEHDYFEDEIVDSLRHTKAGMVSMANKGKDKNGSQFFITTKENLHSLDGTNTIFGEVVEGMDVVMKINNTVLDEHARPLKNIRILHTVVIDDPFDDPPTLEEMPSPEPDFSVGNDRPEYADVEEDNAKDEEEKKKEREQARAKSNAIILEALGDIPYADVKPPDNVLFVCKLNPITREEDLELIFSRFGTITSCEVIRDKPTGRSLCYAFIEYATPEECEKAYAAMDNVIIDDKRIHVDFSQSVSKMGLVGNFKNVGGEWIQVAPDFNAKPSQQSVEQAPHGRSHSRDNHEPYDETEQKHRKHHRNRSHSRSRSCSCSRSHDERKERRSKDRSERSDKEERSKDGRHEERHHRHRSRNEERSRDNEEHRHRSHHSHSRRH